MNKPAAALRSDAAARVGATLRGLRLVGGVRVRSWRIAAELSWSLLSRLERGLVSPSLDTLESVAAALCRSRDCCRCRHNEEVCHVPAGQGICVDQEAGKYCRGELLGHQVPGILAVKPCLMVQEPRVAREATSQSGIRFVYVLSGRGVCTHGSREAPVKPGDALLIDAKVPHGMQTTPGTALASLSVLFALRG